MVQLQNLQREYSKVQHISLQFQDYEDQKYRDLEKIKSLESKNKDLQYHLDESLREFNECDESNKSRIYKLETDLVFATHKIEDLERENELFVQNVNKSDVEITEGAKSLTLATEIGKSLLENTNNDHQDYKELEFVRELETQNQELQQKLDETIEEYNDRDKLNKSKICKLESELLHFKDACALSTLKIGSLEKEIERLIKKPEADPWKPKKSNEKFTVLKFFNSSAYGVPQKIMII
jgi:chromosome segregation ATPase